MSTTFDYGASLDASIERELRTGWTFSASVPDGSRRVLALIVEREGVSEEEVIASERRLRLWTRRRIEQLVSMRLVRRDGDLLRPTLRGTALVRPFAYLTGDQRPSQETLRELRLAELADD
ncbi:hypothetical protein [Microbacterium sp. No. 7]|uniref:hypothetical protein n=1 Tax=Microbacterium sp. No. 7 TaxID=1714373 RepID=UPI0006CFEDAF|nr:hypothetical protein [Microbacterium sp. No. 7]ALJ19602.1 hypothetical protein AOA12_06630 [Microbacterium sp. No. 7]